MLDLYINVEKVEPGVGQIGLGQVSRSTSWVGQKAQTKNNFVHVHMVVIIILNKKICEFRALASLIFTQISKLYIIGSNRTNYYYC